MRVYFLEVATALPVRGILGFQGVDVCTDRVIDDMLCPGSPLCPGWLCRAVILLLCHEPVPGHHCAAAE